MRDVVPPFIAAALYRATRCPWPPERRECERRQGRRARWVGPAILAATLLVCPAWAAPGKSSTALRIVSPPDCVDATGIIPELTAAPLNTTYMRVQHIGDPGSPELEHEVANVVTWSVGDATGFFPPDSSYPHSQRGFRDLGPPNPASAFQLWCNSAGFLINSRRFSHTQPLTLEGPSASVARDLVPAADVFRNWTSALTIDAQISVPYVDNESSPVIDGTAQVSFFYYARDMTTGIVFAHVIALFDNRAPGVNGTAGESISADAYTAFVVSPLRPTLFDGSAAQFVTVGPGSDQMRFRFQWPEKSYFQARIPYANFRAMLVRLQQDSLPAISTRPEDYRITSFGVLGEIFPGTGTDHEVALGASVTDLRLSEAYGDAAPVTVVEYYNAALDHYFISAREADIEALDSGRFGGWARTGEEFNASPLFKSGLQPVCRFYLPPDRGDSHFLSASRTECADVAARFPEFVLEDAEVMYMGMPDANGACPQGSPVFRLWNGRPDTNHRYTTMNSMKLQMLAAGWIAEGYGTDAVAMCTD